MAAAIRQAVECLIQAGLVGWDRVASLQSLPPNPDFNRVALDASASYEEVFLVGLSMKHYNLLLMDQSYFQMSVGKSTRLAYYPNPFTDPNGLLELADDPVDFELIDLAQLRATAGRSPIRFDLSPDQYVPVVHPYAHFHLGHGELGRLSSHRLFCAHSFALLIVKLFYPSEWARFDGDPLANHGYPNAMDAKLASLLQQNGFVNGAHFAVEESRICHVR